MRDMIRSASFKMPLHGCAGKKGPCSKVTKIVAFKINSGLTIKKSKQNGCSSAKSYEKIRIRKSTDKKVS